MKLKKETYAGFVTDLNNCGMKVTIQNIAAKRHISYSKAAEIFNQATIDDPLLKEAVEKYYLTINQSATNEEVVEERPKLEKKVLSIKQYNELLKKASIGENVSEFVYDMCDKFLSNKKTPPRTLLVNHQNLVKKKNGRVLVVCCFDWHMGGKCKKGDTINGLVWSMEAAHDAINNYLNSIIEILLEDKAGFEKVIIMWGGDLYHTLTGTTTKGTQLEVDSDGAEQFDNIHNAIVKFVETLLQYVDHIENHFVKGNHGGDTDYPLGIALKNWFKDYTEENKEKNENKVCTWNVSKSELIFFDVGDHLFILTHGASADTKFTFSANQKGAIEKTCKDIVMNIQSNTSKVYKQKHIFVGDKHHAQHFQFGQDIFFHQCSALVRADSYAQKNNLFSQPSQLVAKFDEHGQKCMYEVAYRE